MTYVSPPRFLAFALCAACFALCGCGGGDSGSAPDRAADSANVRVYNLLLTATGTTPSVDLVVDRKKVVMAVPYRGVSRTADITWKKDAPDTTLYFRNAASFNSLYGERLTLESGSRKLLCLVGQTDTLTAADRSTLVVLGRDATPPATGNIRIRFLHALPDIGPLNIYVGRKGFEEPLVSSLRYKQATNFIEIPLASLDKEQSFVITQGDDRPAPATSLIVLPGSGRFAAGKVYFVPLTRADSSVNSPASFLISTPEE